MKVVVFGATGVIGRAALVHFSQLPDCDVVGVSRRAADVEGVTHVPLDLLDRRACELGEPSHGWHDARRVRRASRSPTTWPPAGATAALMERNLTMFANALEPVLDAAGETLEHVSLLQGAKAYGLHVGRSTVPAKERAPRDDHDNFYFLQEDRLRALAAGAQWSWTILRPQVVYGQSFGSPMNLVPAIGVYGGVAPRARAAVGRSRGGRRSSRKRWTRASWHALLAWAATAPARAVRSST